MTNPENRSLLQQRHTRLAIALQTNELDGLVLNPGPSLTYLTGLDFHLSERPVVAIFVPHTPAIFVLPELELAKLKSFPLSVQAFPYGEDPSLWWDTFRQATQAAKIFGCKVGLEPRRMRVLELRLLEEAAPDTEFVTGEASLSELRITKDESEIAAMQKAVEIAQDALQAVLPQVSVGMTRRELAAELTSQLLRHGSDPQMPFAPIVASGPNSANPHATPSDRALSPGDILLLDWGAGYQGYVSDLTRTFTIGDVDPELEKIALIVEEANQAARQLAAPGVIAGQVDQAARQVIEDAGYGEYFTHRVGHGLGMEGHEPPYLYEQNDLELSAGMTFTIEPGIYLPDRGGVRIEDDCVITTDGGKCLSSLPRQLINLA